jgi:CRISPR system Cascade subunit CasE
MHFSRVRIRPDVRDLHLLISGNEYGAHQLLWKLFPGNDAGTRFLFREEVAREQMPFHKGVRGEPVYYVVSELKPASRHPIFAVESKPYTPRLAKADRLAFRLRANPTIARKSDGKRNSVRHDVVMDAQYHLLREIAEDLGITATGEKSKIKMQLLSSWRELSDTSSIEGKLRSIICENERYVEVAICPLNPSKLLDLALKSRMDKSLENWLCNRAERLGFVLVRGKQRGRLKFQAEGYRWHALPKKGKSAGFSSVDFEGELEVLDPEVFSKALFQGIGPGKAFGCGLMLVRRV